MADEYQYDVFLSHNSKDKPRVRLLAERMRAAKLRVWFDEWLIKPGDDIYLNIERGLQVTRVQVLCLSSAALSSNWVDLERSTVLFRDPSNKNRRFVPLLLDDCDLPEAIQRYQYVDYRQDSSESFLKLLAACAPPSGIEEHLDAEMIPQRFGSSTASPYRVRCTLNCECQYADFLHLRPASYLVQLCNRYPQTDFVILRDSDAANDLADPINPRSVNDLFRGLFRHGEVVTIQVSGESQMLAAEEFKTAWENLDHYADDPEKSKRRLESLLQGVRNRVDGLEKLAMNMSCGGHGSQITTSPEEICRAVAVINDRLHNLSLFCSVETFFEHLCV